MGGNQLVKFVARFVDAETGKPAFGRGWRAKLWDKDLVADDPLGEAVIGETGVVEIVCSSADFQSGLLGRLFDRLKEKKPDVYAEVMEESGRVVYRSPVRWSVDPLRVDEVTGRASPTVDLGTYKVREGEGLMEYDFGVDPYRPLM